VAPLKALCTEKFVEWQEKFESLHGLKCIEYTGDTEDDKEKSFDKLDSANIICTTPVT
jgi:replicative superfamily II helicase